MRGKLAFLVVMAAAMLIPYSATAQTPLPGPIDCTNTDGHDDYDEFEEEHGPLEQYHGKPGNQDQVLIPVDTEWANIDCWVIETPNLIRRKCAVELKCDGVPSITMQGDNYEVWAGATDLDDDGDDDPYIMARPPGGSVTAFACN
ncbi:MAG: hypothetical protein AAF690_16080 [Acidobacteriota bacterium]